MNAVSFPVSFWRGRLLRRPRGLAVATLFFVLVWLWFRTSGLPRSHDVFNFLTLPSTPLTGYRVAVVDSSSSWGLSSCSPGSFSARGDPERMTCRTADHVQAT